MACRAQGMLRLAAACGCVALAVLAAMWLAAVPARAADGFDLWPEDAAPVPAGGLNGQLSLAGLSGGVGNPGNALCCGSGGVSVLVPVPGVAVRDFEAQGLEGQGGAVVLRRARDARLFNPFSGLGGDRAVRFQARALAARGGRAF